MTTKKTLRVPVAADGVPVVVEPLSMDKTRELPAQAAPNEIVDDEVTVPVQSSIESTLTYELLRRQSTVAEEDEE
jgi:hypothetical protein